jgi:hypothetical protein
MALTIADMGKGARKGAPDKRDFRVAFDAVLAPPVDWGNGSKLRRPTNIDQDAADCCVACAWSYYHWQITGQQFSRVDLFARIALAPDGAGAMIRDGGTALVTQGQATEAESPDPDPETDDNMRDATGIVTAGELAWKEYQSFATDLDIGSVARAVTMYKGVACAFYGTDLGWNNDPSVPEPPTAAQMANLDNEVSTGVVWGHALYLVDFHMHTNPDGTQEQCIIGATSWPSLGITEHHMRARYFNTAGAVFDPWTLIPSAAVDAVVNKVVLKIPGRNAAL